MIVELIDELTGIYEEYGNIEVNCAVSGRIDNIYVDEGIIDTVVIDD